MKSSPKRPTKRKNIATSFFEDLRDEPVEIPSFIAERIAAENAEQLPKIEAEICGKTVGEPSDITIGNSSEDRRKLVGNSSDNKIKSEPKPSDKPSDDHRKTVGNSMEIRRKYAPRTPKDVEHLVGHQAAVFDYIFEQAKAYGSSTPEGDRLSPRISSVELVKAATGTRSEYVRDVVSELIKGGLLSRELMKPGPGGFTIYRIFAASYNNRLLNETVGNSMEIRRKNVGKPSDKPSEKPSDLPPSSSRDLYLYNSTTTQPVENSDAEWLENLDLSQVKNFGVTRDTVTRAIQLNPGLKPEQIEDLVWRFGEYAKDPKNRIQNARGFFIELAKQAASGLTPLDHIETPQDRMMREFVAKSQAAKAQREQLESAALEFDFEAWLSNLSRDERDKFVPPNAIIESGSMLQTKQLKEFFRANVWPERKSKIER